jgi:hypothetical protein
MLSLWFFFVGAYFLLFRQVNGTPIYIAVLGVGVFPTQFLLEVEAETSPVVQLGMLYSGQVRQLYNIFHNSRTVHAICLRRAARCLSNVFCPSSKRFSVFLEKCTGSAAVTICIPYCLQARFGVLALTRS